ncbi:hypothetical protein [Vibrio crassostreae]|uniref:hypothetical protein n=1 Tax=Vibrio crassostreae TaxID=246167 RepID=UPI001B307634|nr:hypothetical protein [Vibrio crassostreae]
MVFPFGLGERLTVRTQLQVLQRKGPPLREGSQMGRFKGSRDNKPKEQPKPVPHPKARRPVRKVPSPHQEGAQLVTRLAPLDIDACS